MNSEARRRVVITGMATINPLGDTLEKYYENLINGVSGIKRWTSMDMSKVDIKIGGDIGDYPIEDALARIKEKVTPELYKKLRLKKLFRTATFSNKIAILCAINAYLDASLFGNDDDPFSTSVLVGGNNFNSRYTQKNNEIFNEEPEYIDPLFGIEAIDPNIPATISEVLNVRGPTFTIGAACASSNIALREGFRDIVTGECIRSIVTGAIFDMTPADIHAMAFLNSVVVKPEYQDNPAEASRPWDMKRCGFVPSHGSGTIILEDLETAKKRGAKIYAELLGVKANADANHLPSPSSESQIRLLTDLLKLTGIKPEQINYINCHATATPLGDTEEIKAIKTVFGEHAYKLKLNAPKSMLGHTCWAAPIVELIGGILQMNNGVLHPSINIDELDPYVDLDVCANQAQEFKVEYMMKNSFGFGGLNCCSMIKRFDD